MDRKTFIVLAVSGALLLIWPALTNRMFPPVPLPGGTNAVRTLGGTNPATGSVAPPPSANLTTANTPALPPAAPEAAERPNPALTPTPTFRGPEELLVVDTDLGRYTFTSHGGGLKRVELKGYPAIVDCRRSGNALSNGLATLNGGSAVPAMAIRGGPELEGDGSFTLTRTDTGVRAVKSLPSGLQIEKEFSISTNFMLRASVRLRNGTAQPLVVPAQEWIVGTASATGKADESLMLGLEWYDGATAHRADGTWFDNRTLGCLPGQPRSLYAGGSSNVVWAAVRNQFFTIIAIPRDSAPQVVGRRVPVDPIPGTVSTAPPQLGYQAALAYPPLVIDPGQTIERPFDVYAGPKEYFTLSRMEKNVDLVMGFDGFWGFFPKALLLSMNGIHSVIPSYGFVIIVITIIIKLLFWPLTNASTRSMKRMAELQPQMKALQEKYKDDPKKMNQKLMEFMRENKVSPLGGCLPMLLQIPVFIGFYRMLQSAIELRGAQFLWACDLSQADTIFVIPFLEFPVNPMPLLMGATMLWQAQLTPAAPGMDPTQQKIMKYMPLMFMVFLYSFSAGLTLYWTVQNLLTIAQMKLTRSQSPGPAGAAATIAKPQPPRKKG